MGELPENFHGENFRKTDLGRIANMLCNQSIPTKALQKIQKVVRLNIMPYKNYLTSKTVDSASASRKSTIAFRKFTVVRREMARSATEDAVVSRVHLNCEEKPDERARARNATTCKRANGQGRIGLPASKIGLWAFNGLQQA